MVVRAYARLGDTRRSHCDRDGGRPGNFCRLCCKRPVSRLAWSGAHWLCNPMVWRFDGWQPGAISPDRTAIRSEEHTSELQSLMRISYAVFCLKKKKIKTTHEKTRDRNHTRTYSQIN